MFQWLRRKCSMCKRSGLPLRSFQGRDGKAVKLCPSCAEYGERRAFERK
ncbi:hypothetical protein [Domibacillus enclensis]|nr:hypothetical protein [Domibacillus enclensis]